MPHLKRSLWLLAWTAWLLLGLGFHRQLPRNMELVCQLPLDRDEKVRGFLGHEDVVVTEIDTTAEFRCRDARTGELLRRCPGRRQDVFTTTVWARQGVVFGRRDDDSRDLDALNLRTGVRTKLPPTWRPRGYHPDRPWAAGELERSADFRDRIVVVDVHTGARIAEWTSPPNTLPLVQEAQFVGDDALLMIEDGAWRDGKAPPQRIERWNVLTGEQAPPIPLPAHYESWSQARGGRLLLMRDLDDEGLIDVLDHRTGAVIAERIGTQADRDAHSPKRRSAPIELSPSGRRMLSYSGALWNVDDQRRLWSPHRDLESVRSSTLTPDRLSVLEDWFRVLPDWDLVRRVETTAIRDLETGAVLYRVWGIHPPLGWLNAAGTLGVDDDHRVVALSPNSNDLLLTLLQTLLALPLILLWSLLRLRRRPKASGGRQPPVEAAP